MHPNDIKRMVAVALMLTALVALRPTLARANGVTDTPAAATIAFYQWVLGQKSGGLPTPQQRSQLRTLVTKDLLQALAATSNTEQQCVDVTPQDMKPPIWEGSIWVGNYEGAAEAAYGEPRITGSEATVRVDLGDIDTRFPRGHWNRAIAWHDTLKLRKVKQGWRVADVLRGESQESLMAALKQYVTEEGPRCRNQRQASRQRARWARRARLRTPIIPAAEFVTHGQAVSWCACIQA